MGKVLFILVDALSLASARECMSFMRAMTEAGKARTGEHRAFLPPLSRPAYATLLTGRTPLEHGILSNENRPEPLQNTFFHLAARAGLRTAAAAYGWFHELCMGGPFELSRHRLHKDEHAPIQHALFYGSDAYPDQEAFADAEALRKAHKPDLLLLHSMGVDWAGHEYGGNSCQYRAAVRNVDSLLAKYAPLWLDEDYTIFLTGDHGMNAEGSHYDADAQCRDVPCWLMVKGPRPLFALPESPAKVSAWILSVLGVKSEGV